MSDQTRAALERIIRLADAVFPDARQNERIKLAARQALDALAQHEEAGAQGLSCEGGVTVRWCPRCGTCTCPSQNEKPDGWEENPTCPIHGARSDHAEPLGAQAPTRAQVEALRQLSDDTVDRGGQMWLAGYWHALDRVLAIYAAQETPKTCATCRHWQKASPQSVLAGPVRCDEPRSPCYQSATQADFGCVLWAPRAGETAR